MLSYIRMGLIVANLSVSAKFIKGVGNIISDLSFSVPSGKKLAIVGESGSGKTMTALAILGLLPENCFLYGRVELDGVILSDLNEKKFNAMRGRDIVYIPQSGLEYLNPSLKIKNQIYECLKLNKYDGDMQAQAEELLCRVGLCDSKVVLEKYPHELSGGQAQRVTLAMALTAKPKLVIADEPMSGVDSETSLELMRMLFNEFKGASLIIITHNFSYAKACDDILVLKDGVVMEKGGADKIMNSPNSEYTKLLLSLASQGE